MDNTSQTPPEDVQAVAEFAQAEIEAAPLDTPHSTPDEVAALVAHQTHPAGGKAFEQWALEKGTDPAMLAAARAVGKWAQGRELSESDYDAAVATAAGASMGG